MLVHLMLLHLPCFCHTPSLKLQIAGHWIWQSHRRGGTSASPSMERNLQSLKTVIVYINFLLRDLNLEDITGRFQLILQQSTKHKTKLSWSRHIRCMKEIKCLGKDKYNYIHRSQKSGFSMISLGICGFSTL